MDIGQVLGCELFGWEKQIVNNSVMETRNDEEINYYDGYRRR